MFRRIIVLMGIAASAGLVVTLLTGLYPTYHAAMQVDVAQMGSPFPWLTRVIPTRIYTVHERALLSDTISWSAIFFIILSAVKMLNSRLFAGSAASKRQAKPMHLRN